MEALAGPAYNESRANKFDHALDSAQRTPHPATHAQASQERAASLPKPAPVAIPPDSVVRRKFHNPGSWVPPQRFPADSSELELFYGLVKLEDSSVQFSKVLALGPARARRSADLRWRDGSAKTPGRRRRGWPTRSRRTS